MILGNKYILILFLLLFHNYTFAENKITSSPLINLNKIKPSFDELNNNSDFSTNEKYIKEKKKIKNTIKSSHVVLIGLDKITAKSSQFVVNLNEVKEKGILAAFISFNNKGSGNNGFSNKSICSLYLSNKE